MEKVSKKRIILAVVGTLALLGSFVIKFLEFRDKVRRNDHEQRVLTVSIEPQRYLLQQIVGFQFDVQTLLAAGADPENFDPSMAAMRNLSKSEAYFTTGQMPFEAEIARRIAEADSGIRIVDTSAGIELLHGTHNCEGHHHDGDAADPHVWSSVANARIMAKNMLDVVLELNPAGAENNLRRYNELMARLDTLESTMNEMLEPCRGDAFMVWHPSLSYFARDYGLRQIAMGSDNKESSAAGLRERIDHAASSGARVFFVQPEYDGSPEGRSQSILANTPARAVTINPLAYQWPDQMLLLARSIADAHQPADSTSRQ